jgi:hypothetical protein
MGANWPPRGENPADDNSTKTIAPFIRRWPSSSGRGPLRLSAGTVGLLLGRGLPNVNHDCCRSAYRIRSADLRACAALSSDTERASSRSWLPHWACPAAASPRGAPQIGWIGLTTRSCRRRTITMVTWNPLGSATVARPGGRWLGRIGNCSEMTAIPSKCRRYRGPRLPSTYRSQQSDLPSGTASSAGRKKGSGRSN